MRPSKPAHCLRGWYALFRFSSVAFQSDRPEVEKDGKGKMFVARGFEKSRAGFNSKKRRTQNAGESVP